jgi:hypothetical protein
VSQDSVRQPEITPEARDDERPDLVDKTRALQRPA